MTDTTLPTTRIVLVAQYFGPLPAYFRAWLETCRRNDQFYWLFSTDQQLDNFDIPINVNVVHTTLEETRRIFSDYLHTDVSLTRPYKICDLKPFLWILLDHHGIQYSHWGHCDIDMVFGNFSAFLTPYRLEGAERVFENGHFSIYRNSRLAKSMAFSTTNMFVDWKKVVTSESSFGYDEHHGVNRAWAAFPELWRCDDSVIYDIEPNVAALAPASGAIFPRQTSICWWEGRLTVTETSAFGTTAEREVMAAHFQKRPITISADFELADGFQLLPNAIVPLSGKREKCVASNLHPSENQGFSFHDWRFLARNRLRKSKLIKTLRRLRENRL